MSNIDSETLNQLIEDIPPVDLRNVLKMFQDDMQQLSQKITASAMVGDLESFRRSAHSLAGAASAIGAVTLETVARAAMKLTEAEASLASEKAAAIAGLAEEAIGVLRRVGTGGRLS